MSILTIKRHGTFRVKNSTKLIDCLAKNGIPIIATCGGKGRCGSCRVRIITPQKPQDERETLFIPQSALKQGYRLACQHKITHDMTIDIPCLKKVKSAKLKSNYGLALDIGTTVIKGAAVNLKNGDVEKICKVYNLQNSIGGDIITRVSASIDGKYDILRKLLYSSLKQLKNCLGVQKPAITIIVGNPVMLSFYLHEPINGFAQYPFTSNLNKGIFLKNPPRYVFPIIGGFVGGDTISGILASRMHKSGKNSLYIDLGTNGEVVLIQGKNIYAASTAAGPAFEGIGVDCGCLAIPGAIDQVSYSKGNFRFHTINKEKPIGLCASGLIDLLAILLSQGILKENGRLKHAVQLSWIDIDQGDIRKLQLATGAIHSGIKILLNQARIGPERVDETVITGEFGSKLNIKALIRIGLLPEGIQKISFEKDLPLQGAIKTIQNNKILNQSEEIRELSTHIDLAAQPDFQEVFVSSLKLAPWN